MIRVAARVLLATALALGVAGCAGLSTLQNVTTPSDLYDLTPKSTHDPNLPAIEAQIVVEEPTAASAVNTDRIAVRPTPYQVQYFPGVRWVDRAPPLVQSLLVESFENTDKVRAVGRQAFGLTSDFTLVTDLREFQAELDAGAAGAISVVVHLNMKIVQEPRGLIVASRSFVERAPTESEEISTIVAAFDKALGRGMGDAVDWAVRRIAEIAN